MKQKHTCRTSLVGVGPTDLGLLGRVGLAPQDLALAPPLGPSTARLQAQIAHAAQQQDAPALARYAAHMQRRWAASGAPLRYGSTLLALAAGWLRLARYARAQAGYQEAQTIFKLRVAPRQRQNEAAACYGLALTAALRGAPLRSLEWVEKTVALLQEAEQYWVMCYADYEHADACARLRLPLEQQLTLFTDPLRVSAANLSSATLSSGRAQ